MKQALTLDELLDNVSVGIVDDDHNTANNGNLKGILGWWYVADNKGARAYFGREIDAFSYRLHLINAALNPIKVK